MRCRTERLLVIWQSARISAYYVFDEYEVFLSFKELSVSFHAEKCIGRNFIRLMFLSFH